MKTRFSAIALMFLFPNFAQGAGIAEEPFDPKVEILAFSYTYNLVYNEGKAVDCSGSVDFRVTYPPQTRTVVVARTVPHITDTQRLFFSIKRTYEVTDDGRPVEVHLENIKWGTYLQVYALDTEGEATFADIMCVNPYINEEDFKLITGISSTENAGDPLPIVDFSKSDLTINANQSADIKIFDLLGKCLYAGRINGATLIPIDKDLTSPLIILIVMNDNKLLNLKIQRK